MWFNYHLPSLLSGVLTTLPHLVIPNYPDKQRAILPCLETKEVRSQHTLARNRL